MNIDFSLFDEEIEREIARRSLHEFIQYINPEYITSHFSRTVCDALDQFLIDMMEGKRPIGIVVWFAQNKNPNTLFPGTKWQYIGENKTIRLAAASGANVLTTGGSDSVTIGKNHLPATPLKFSGTTASGGAHDHTRGTMNITGELGYMRNDSNLYTYATGAFSLANGSGNGGYTGSNLTNSRKYVFNAARTWSGSTSQHGGHTHTYSGNTENLGSGAALAVTNAYIMLMGWYRIS